MAYDWLSRKTTMTDPDMGRWSYAYASNGSLISQTDAKNQTISFSYDGLNRLTGKTYPAGLNMATVTYTYDSITGSNYGKGLRTGMSDGSGTMAYTYDNRGRFIQEKRTVDSVDYITGYAYDGVNRVATVTYPGGEKVTQTYNGRGLPYSLSSSGSGTIVSSMLYNNLALPTEMNLHSNNMITTYGYWDTGGSYDTTGGYYGKLWKIKTVRDPSGTPITLQEVKHTWDAGGNLITRENVVDTETENFSYDNLDRLISAAGPYSESYTYNQIGNMTGKAGLSYSYGSKPHSVAGVGSTNYIYDNNGNMTTRGTASLAWDAENRLTGISGTASVTYVYDGDGFRVKKTEGNTTILYINKYYEKNLSTGYIISYYYFGDKMVAYKDSSDGFGLKYVHQDHLTGTSIVTNTTGTIFYSSIKYKPYGESRYISGSPPAQQFTGQRLDDVGLYYYASKSPFGNTRVDPARNPLAVSGLWAGRYYDPTLARFTQADTIVPNIFDPQSLNRFSYVENSPQKYRDDDGHFLQLVLGAAAIGAVLNSAIYVGVSWHLGTQITGAGLAGAAVSGAISGAVSVLALAPLAPAINIIGNGFEPYHLVLLGHLEENWVMSQEKLCSQQLMEVII